MAADSADAARQPASLCRQLPPAPAAAPALLSACDAAATVRLQAPRLRRGRRAGRSACAGSALPCSWRSVKLQLALQPLAVRAYMAQSYLRDGEHLVQISLIRADSRSVSDEKAKHT